MPPPSPAGKSCVTCPSFLQPRDQAAMIGGVVGGPLCGRFMKLLTRPTQPHDVAQKVLRDTASKCSEYGKEVTLTPIPETRPVFFQVGIDVGAKIQSERDAEAENPSCRLCANYVAPNDVIAVVGWSQPFCRGMGSVMVDTHLEANAKTCGKFVVQVGPRIRSNLHTLNLMPIFSTTYGIIDLAKQYVDAVNAAVERDEYPTDKPVGPKALARGIRAWRAIKDPLGYGADVFLPIYDSNAKIKINGQIDPLFTERELQLIPNTGDDEHPELYADHAGLIYRLAVLLMKLDDTPALWGQGGTGKTEIARHLAWMMGLPFHRISINGASEIDDIAGKYIFVGNETKIHWGRLSASWQRPGMILLDEPNTGPNDIWQLIRSLTDNSRMLVVDHLDATRIRRHSDAFFVMAMNPAWDVRNAGTHDVGDADISRLAHIMFDLPPRDLEIEIIRKRVELDGWEIPNDSLNKVMDVAKEVREASANNTLNFTWGIRHNIRVARNLQFFPGPLAYRMAIGDSLEPSQLEVLLRSVRSQFGD